MTKTDANYIHSYLLKIVQKSDDDFEPLGNTKRKEFSDCSCGCSYFLKLEGQLGNDWGVCTNISSHRCGLLTFEHQGCKNFSKNSTIGKEGQ